MSSWSRENQPPVKWGLPETVEYCRRCVISNQRPSTVVEFEHGKETRKPTIGFADGVCSACRYHDEKYNVIDWRARERELVDLLDRFRRSDGSYDVVVPGSGPCGTPSIAQPQLPQIPSRQS